MITTYIDIFFVVSESNCGGSSGPKKVIVNNNNNNRLDTKSNNNQLPIPPPAKIAFSTLLPLHHHHHHSTLINSRLMSNTNTVLVSSHSHTHPLPSPSRTPTCDSNICFRKCSLGEERFGMDNEKNKISMKNKSDKNIAYENLNMDYITQLTSEGYTQDAVIRALGITRNDVKMACDILHEFATKKTTTGTT